MPNIQKEAILECINCGRRYTALIWVEIQINENKTIDNQIFKDEINFFECSHCSNKGFVIYPIKIKEKESGEISVVIPMASDTEEDDPDEEIPYGFFVVKILGKRPFRVFNYLNDLKWYLAGLHWGFEPPVFDPPPEERDIQEAIEKGLGVK